MKALRLIDATIITGALLGFGNSGFCISCFLENLAGSLQLHDNIRMSYIRPELIGFVLGAFFMALQSRRFKVTGGSSPIIRFLLGFFILVGCAVFIGCPIKMILRLAAGDLTAIAATAGLIFGIWLGAKYIRAGFSLDRVKELPQINGYIIPAFAVLALLFLLLKPSFIITGETGPAAMRAPIYLSLLVGLAIGVFAQKSGLCITGGIRNFCLVRERTLLNGVITVFVTALILSLIMGQFNLGMNAQPSSHLSHGWTFLAMVLVGLASTLIDGCPFRQLIKAGQGDVDAGITILGMTVGAALVISWAIRSSSAGPTFEGKITVLLGLIFSLILVTMYRKKKPA
jgi:YedE family putative selenium metabolism protein